MTVTGAQRRRLAPRARLACLLLAPLAVGLGLLVLGSGPSAKAAAEAGGGEPLPYTDVAVPAANVVMLGATPDEPGAPEGTTWGLGERSEGGVSVPKLVRYVPPSGAGGFAEEGGWEPGPELPAGFQPDHPKNGTEQASPLEGQMTPGGYGVLAGTITHEKETRQALLVRRPGGAFEATAPVPAEGEVEAEEQPLLHEGQTLFGGERAPMIAPLAEADGSAGALVVPVYSQAGVDEAVLHWNGHSWASEPIEIPEASRSEFKVLAIAASSPQNAWLLARLSSGYGPGAVALFRRVEAEGGGWSWRPVEVEAGPGQVKLPLSVPVSGGAPAAGEPFGVFGDEGSRITVESQLLTVTSDGVWVDGVRTDVEHQQPYTTMYVRLEGDEGVIEHSWCKAAAGTPPCQGSLPEEPPLEYGRSFAWPSSSPYGERVITGLYEGVILRLESSGSFEPVLSIGGGETPEAVPGQLYGAAFSSPSEGWLGYAVPVQMTTSPEPDRLAYWPVATRHPLLAIAPEPGAPVAALSSEALAVGESGGVARYKPGEGWLPESLFGPGERIETPNLRAVAWPRANRAYAVGEAGEMWLWRSETGLWERDPATPVNFRDNLYGIAFDSTEPARGYAVGAQAVGRGGVILRYGKTWTEETELPAEVQDAQFTGVAFAGSEAMVAFDVQRSTTEEGFNGGLLVNEGSGWRVDQEEEQVTGSARVLAVAGLPDGGAAVLAGEGTARLYERESGGAPWRQVSTPLPSGLAGSLALYRHNGALRALLSAGGAASETRAILSEPPPGTPPYEQKSAGVGGGPEAGALLRQTASGWIDERHSVNPVKQSREYGEYDEPSYPDPISAALVSPTGSEAWVVGGITSERVNEQTADVARYPAEGRPPNEGTSQIPVQPEETQPAGSGGVTTLAFGGGASCADPCADRVETGVGPNTWLSNAISLARAAGASAFFYTGPMISYSQFSGQVPPQPPFAEEYERYARLLGGDLLESGASWPAYAADSNGELEGEAALVPAFEHLASPLGSSSAQGWTPAGVQPSPTERENCGCADGYYAVQNARVEVVVLDDSAGDGVDAAQRVWLEQQLEQAGAVLHKPVIVVAEADLGQQLAAGKHEEAAEELFAALVGRDPDGRDPGGYAASAYFYDAPENNVRTTISFDGASLRAFGSGTLGYELEENENTTEFHGAKGILLGEVQWAAASAAEQAADRAPVEARLIPVIGELAMEAQEGTLLRRSEVVRFSGLARRPRAGCRGVANEDQCTESQYIPIPSICIGTRCAEAVLPEYEFRSSRPDIGGFVKLNAASNSSVLSSSSVLVNANGEPVKDGREQDGEQVGATSGLFCAYNKGETLVTLSAGGLSYTLPVRVQAGSVREPCGTVPLRELPPVSTQVAPPTPAPASQPAPAATPPAAAPPPIPLPPPPQPPAAATVHRPAAPAPPPSFLPLVAPATPLLAFVPPPVPTPARPTPPTGTSAVTSPVEVAEKEEEREEAPESVSNKAVAYTPQEHEPAPLYLLGMVIVAALAAASARRRPRRGHREVRVAPATLNATRAQRRWSDRRQRPPR
ncbi:MAG TPA: hypothetical protein VMF09_15305 [Solirubrobacteraceae bacterium]|nr:hypothetical protein [Solirubrobacteraceae bacterium]